MCQFCGQLKCAKCSTIEMFAKIQTEGCFVCGQVSPDDAGDADDIVALAALMKRGPQRTTAHAAWRIAMLRMQGVDGARPDLVEAERLFRVAADNGHLKSQMIVASDYARKGSLDSVTYFAMAAKQGQVAAMAAVGATCQQKANAATEAGNDAEVVRWFTIAADIGGPQFVSFQANLSCHYATGRGVKRDMVQASRYSRLAAENGDVQSMCSELSPESANTGA
jgi:TPR repeat protein